MAELQAHSLKRCTACGEWLQRDKFVRNRSSADGLHSYCRPCQRAKVKEYRLRHVEKFRKINRRKMRERRATPEGKAQESKRGRHYRQTPPGRYYAMKKGARDRALSFDVTLDHYTAFLFDGPCHWCGGETSGGVDRMDNSIGYTPDNCVSCCPMCNRMKSAYGADEWLDHLAVIVALHAVR